MIRTENLSFTYPGKKIPTLRNVDISANRGEFVLITGPTGCGKSTLLKCLCGIIPHSSEGEAAGNVYIDDLNVADTLLPVLSRKVGLVQQNPDDQIFSLNVEDEVAFGPENLNLSPVEIDQMIEKALDQVGMTGFRRRSIQSLSGGQKQRVAIAAILSMSPSLILLDEPASQLDPLGAQEVFKVITEINAIKKSTIVLVEHRIHEVAHLVDRIIVLNNGSVVLDTGKKNAFEKHLDIFLNLGLRVPETVELFHRLKISGAPLTEQEAFISLKKIMKTNHVTFTESDVDDKRNKVDKYGAPVVKMKDTWFYYEDEDWILKGVDLEIHRGEIVALLGDNGSGKSTLLLHMCGILKPKRGSVTILDRDATHIKPEHLAGEVAVVFQDPGLMLFCETVWDETAFGPKNLKFSKEDIHARVSEAIGAMTIEDLSTEPPQALSGGQRLRTAVASVLSLRPALLLLDEPTSGQDKRNIVRFMDHVKALKEDGVTSVFITHDMETALQYADRVIVLNNGKVMANGPVETVFKNKDLIEKTALKLPQSMTLSARLGFPHTLSVYKLAEMVNSVTANV